MKKIIVLAIILLLAIPAAAWAEDYFTPAEKQEIRRTVSRVLPGKEVDFNDTEVDGVGISIGPLREGNFLFIPVNADGEMFIYKAPGEYSYAVNEILRTVWRIVDNRPASRVLKRDLIK